MHIHKCENVKYYAYIIYVGCGMNTCYTRNLKKKQKQKQNLAHSQTLYADP